MSILSVPRRQFQSHSTSFLDGACSSGGESSQRRGTGAAGSSPGGAAGGGEAGETAGDGASGMLYKLAGMSVEERQQMLDLREEV